MQKEDNYESDKAKPFLTEDLLRFMREARRFDSLLSEICGLRNSDLTDLQPLYLLMTEDPLRNGLTVQELVDKLSLRRPFLTYLLKNLAMQGYIYKRDPSEVDPTADRRTACITLTDKGEEYCTKQAALFNEKLEKLQDMPRTGHVGKYKDICMKLEKANAYLNKTIDKRKKGSE